MKHIFTGNAAFGALAFAVATCCVTGCGNLRDTPESIKAARKAVAAELRKTPPDAVLPALEKLASETSFRYSTQDSFPYITAGFRTRVPMDFIAQLTEEAILRFAGNDADIKADTQHLKAAVEFAGRLIPKCSADAANGLRDRRLDGCFLMKDYDAAVTFLKAGHPGHSDIWRTGTIAKLLAHKAMDAGDKKEAAKQFAIFGTFLASDEMKDFEDCDPTTGIVYSIDWVVARNFMRCSKLAAETGDAKSASDYAAKAKPFFQQALEKVKDDDRSLKALRDEMKSFGL